MNTDSLAFTVALVALAVAIYAVARRPRHDKAEIAIKQNTFDKFTVDDRAKDLIDKHVSTYHRGQHQ